MDGPSRSNGCIGQFHRPGRHPGDGRGGLSRLLRSWGHQPTHPRLCSLSQTRWNTAVNSFPVSELTFVQEEENHCRFRSFTNPWIFATSMLSAFFNCFRRGTQVWRGIPRHVESHIHKPNDKRHEEENAEQFREGGGGVIHPFSPSASSLPI